MRHPNKTTTRIAVLALLASLFAGVEMLRPTVAVAAPSTTDLEEVIEKYNQITDLIADDQTRAAVLTRTIKNLSRQITAAHNKLRPVVRRFYEVGQPGALRIVLDGAGMAGLVNQQGMAVAYAHHVHAQVAALAKARTRATAAKKTLDATLASLTRRRADLARQKATILTRLAAEAAIDARLPATDTHDTSPLKPVPCPYSAPVTVDSTLAVEAACAQIGKPYVWATAGPRTFDCSGLMVYAWAQVGVHLRHFTGYQWHDLTPISRSQLRPGDLVFFFPPTMHHVGMYIGGGWMVVAPHTGDVVRLQKVFDGRMPIGGYRRP